MSVAAAADVVVVRLLYNKRPLFRDETTETKGQSLGSSLSLFLSVCVVGHACARTADKDNYTIEGDEGNVLYGTNAASKIIRLVTSE